MLTSRRAFLSQAAIVTAGATLAAPALANSSPEVRWTMASAFPPSLEIVFDGARTCAAATSEATDGRFTISVQPAGSTASAYDALNAVADGKADCAHTSLSYSWTQHPAYAFGSGVPFGMNARQHAAWLRIGGGNERIDDLLAERGLMALPMGSAGGQMAGWFRKEVRKAGDLAGMKLRIGGFAGKVLKACGATVVALPKDQILEALASGSLDAFESIAPYDDERFAGGRERAGAISTVAPYYYCPGWWKGETQLHLIVSRERFAGLPKAYQAAVKSAAALADGRVRAQYDAANPAALKRLVMGGAQLRLFPQEVLESCYRATNNLYAELSAQNAKFKTVADCYMAFRSDQYLWWQVAEYPFDNFMIRERRAESLTIGARIN